MKQETRRQHYVPRTYLQKFGIKRKKNYNIYALNKSMNDRIICPNVNNICLETDIYTLKGNTEDQRQAVETFYSNNVENLYNEVYEVLTDSKVKEISEDMHYKIIMTVITMLYRTSKWIHTHNAFFDRVLARIYEICIETKKDYFNYEGVKFSIKGKTLQDIQKEFRIKQKEAQILIQLEVAFKLISIRKFDGILVSKLMPEHELITSDNPVLLSNLEFNNVMPFDPENMIYLPINPNHILTIMPHSQSDGSHYITRINQSGSMSLAKMISNNTSQFANAYKYILGSKKGINDFISSKMKYEEPISEEYRKNVQDFIEYVKEIIRE